MNFNRNMNSRQLEKFRKIGSRFGLVLGILLLILIVALPVFNLLTDYIWMKELSFGDVYKKILVSKVFLGVVGFLLFAITTYVTVFWIRRSYLSHLDQRQLPPLLLKRKQSTLLMTVISIFIGAVGSLIVQSIGWEPALKVFNYASFGKVDPFFNKDVSFYIFVLPFLQFILYILLGLSIFFMIVQIGAYSVFHMFRMSRVAQLQLGITLAFIGILFAGIHLITPYGTLLTDQVNLFQKSVVTGLSYTDKVINIPKSYILAGVAVIGTIWMIVMLYRGKINAMLVPIVFYIALVILGQGASVVVQNFVVSPNEFSKESPYLEHNLDFTRTAYGIDNIKEEEHPGNYSLDEDMIKRNELTLGNVRLNDSRPLLDVFNQLQTFRTYYKFNDMDIDRYEIDGEYEQVFVGARELNTDNLPSQAKTWVNKTLRYTHGYGVAMSHVNDVTSQGQPEYLINNIPAEGAIDIERPQIYFGEEDYPNVIVNSEVDEFDYPTGDANESHRYESDTGIPFKGLNRFLFSLDEGSFRMFVSDQITKESQFLKTRNIKDRVNKIAPFFEYDNDPYIVVRDDGSLVWVIDAYLSAAQYPYSEAHSGNENYIRNSVKAVVDAYTGEVDFYISDPEDPLLLTYQSIFPDLFTEEVPEDIQKHFRYPADMFKIQSKMYGTYHMSNLEVFYNREDFWQFPTEKYFNQDIEMEPYYITMRLPENDEEEFILMMPYTPKKRQNMISWIGVRSDGEHYGELFVYKFPKQKNVYGPQQIENRINQDPAISQKLNLWAQGGSDVIRGNLLAIPIEDTILYVEPVYIESSNETSLPEVKQVVMAYGDNIVMEATFEESLDKIISMLDPENEPEPDEEESIEDTKKQIEEEMEGETEETEEPEESVDPILGAEEQLTEIGELFDSYRDALSDSNWEKAGEIMQEIETKLNNKETD